MPIRLEKTYTREHSLFYCRVWDESNAKDIMRLIDIPCNVFFQGENKRLSVWYSKDELNSIFTHISNKIVGDPAFFNKIKNDFYLHWNKLLALVHKEKKIENIDDLKDFYKTFVKWWSPMAVALNIPEMENVDKSIRKEALEMRKETESFSDDGDRLFVEFFTEYFPEYTNIMHILSPEEIFELKKGPLSTQKIEEIKERDNGYIVFKGGIYLSSERDTVLNKNNLELVEDKVERVNEIKGTPACKGTATGKVRLLLYKDDIHTLEEGEILVTEMTSPDFVPAMKKSAAIVTNEGGVTCHAAIVSRELNKPCIIGTKVATKVLKDGDLVEIDAEKGIVKIIK